MISLGTPWLILSVLEVTMIKTQKNFTSARFSSIVWFFLLPFPKKLFAHVMRHGDIMDCLVDIKTLPYSTSCSVTTQNIHFKFAPLTIPWMKIKMRISVQPNIFISKSNYMLMILLYYGKTIRAQASQPTFIEQINLINLLQEK